MNRESLEGLIIGILLAFPDSIAKSDLELDDFSCDPWRTIYQSMRSILAEGLEIDVFSVKERVDVELSTLVYTHRNATSSANLHHYVAALRKMARTEKLTELCQKTLSAISDGLDADKTRGRLITRLSEMDDRKERLDYNMADLSRMAVDYLELAQEASRNGKTVGVPTGVTLIDKITGGLHPSNMIVVGARPGMGKTALTLSLSVNMTRLGYKVGFISTEMSGVEVGMRVMSLVSGVSAELLRNADLRDSDYGLLMSHSGELKSMPLRVLDKPSCTLGDIMIQCRSWMLTGGIDVLMVDYLQRLQAEDKSESRTREVGKLAMGLKTLARQMKIPVVVLSQLNRASSQRQDKTPTMADLRDSGEIEQEADMVWLLHRPSVYDPEKPEYEAEIIVEKNRHGPTLTILAHWDHSVMRWENRRLSHHEERYA